MSAPVMEPSACTWCGIAQRGHGRQYADAAGWHAWEQPSQEQILARMKARRLQLAVARAGALPMSVGGERTLDVVEEELTGVNLALWEEIQGYARLRLALASAQRGRRELRSALRLSEPSRERWRAAAIEVTQERDALRTRVAELELTVQQMCDALNGHDCPPPDETPFELVTRVSIAWSEAERKLAELEAAEQRREEMSRRSRADFAEQAKRETDPERRALLQTLSRVEAPHPAPCRFPRSPGCTCRLTGAEVDA